MACDSNHVLASDTTSGLSPVNDGREWLTARAKMPLSNKAVMAKKDSASLVVQVTSVEMRSVIRQQIEFDSVARMPG